MNKRTLLILTLVIAFIQQLKAQVKDDDLIQVSGIVISADSLRALPLVSIRIKGTNRGTYSDPGGFFSFVVRKGDTVTFSMIGEKTVEYPIPLSVTSYRYSIIVPMDEDTLYLPETVIRPWPTPEEFNYMFVKAKIPDDYGYRARYNTRRETLQDMAAGMSFDGRMNQQQYMLGQYERYYYNGQLPPQRLFDPFAWSQFFNSWKRGDLKRKN
jgi:hypothetical protein